MTANAMQRDRDRCLDAGMDDFLAKPIDPDQMMNTLAKWLGARARQAALAPAPTPALAAPSFPETAGLPAVPGLDVAQGLKRMLGRKPLYLAMLRRWVDSQKDSSEQVRTAIDAGDWETAERIAHTAKGLAGNIGAQALSTQATLLEDAIRQRAPAPQIAMELGHFSIALQALVVPLQHALG